MQMFSVEVVVRLALRLGRLTLIVELFVQHLVDLARWGAFFVLGRPGRGLALTVAHLNLGGGSDLRGTRALFGGLGGVLSGGDEPQGFGTLSLRLGLHLRREDGGSLHTEVSG